MKSYLVIFTKKFHLQNKVAKGQVLINMAVGIPRLRWHYVTCSKQVVPTSYGMAITAKKDNVKAVCIHIIYVYIYICIYIYIYISCIHIECTVNSGRSKQLVNADHFSVPAPESSGNASVPSGDWDGDTV